MSDDDIDYGISVLLQENATLKRQLADVTAKRDALIERLVEAGDGLICGGAMMDIEMAKLENVWHDTVAEYQAMKKESVE